jgi:hypothetical protein
MDNEFPEELLPTNPEHNHGQPQQDKPRGGRLVRRIMVGAAVIISIPFLVYFARIWIPKIWTNLHFVNFIVASIPTILSILFAFIVDKDLEHRMRKRWRLCIVAVGMIYSCFLWHQQDLTDQANAKQTTDAVTTAVQTANNHTDAQFKLANQHADSQFGAVQKDVKGVSDQNVALSQALARATGDINTNLGKVGKPDPPVPAALNFTLWDLNASIDRPVRTRFLQPDADGNFPVEFSFVDVSTTSAKAIDIWVQLCDACSFAKEPAGFEHPAGGLDQVRHRHIGDLNSGIAFEKITLSVKAPRSPGFQVGFRYTCENCGGKVSENQVVTITEGIVGPIFPVKNTPPK